MLKNEKKNLMKYSVLVSSDRQVLTLCVYINTHSTYSCSCPLKPPVCISTLFPELQHLWRLQPCVLCQQCMSVLTHPGAQWPDVCSDWQRRGRTWSRRHTGPGSSAAGFGSQRLPGGWCDCGTTGLTVAAVTTTTASAWVHEGTAESARASRLVASQDRVFSS